MSGVPMFQTRHWKKNRNFLSGIDCSDCQHCAVPALCVAGSKHMDLFVYEFCQLIYLKKNVLYFSRLLCGCGWNVDTAGQLTAGWFHKRPQIDRFVCVCSAECYGLCRFGSWFLLGIVERQNTPHCPVLFHSPHFMKWQGQTVPLVNVFTCVRNYINI